MMRSSTFEDRILSALNVDQPDFETRTMRLTCLSDLFLIGSLISKQCYVGVFCLAKHSYLSDSKYFLERKEDFLEYEHLICSGQFDAVVQKVRSLELKSTDYLRCDYKFATAFFFLTLSHAHLKLSGEDKDIVIQLATDIYLHHIMDNDFTNAPKQAFKSLVVFYYQKLVLEEDVISKNEQMIFSSLALMADDLKLYKEFRLYSKLFLDEKESQQVSRELGYTVKAHSGERPAGFLLAALRLYDGDSTTYLSYFNKKPKYYDPTYAELLAGKSVAIVGPVDVGKNNGPEIDGFDIVVRFNFKGLQGFDVKSFGSRTDISYYVTADVKKILNDKSSLEAVECLKFSLHSGGAYNYVKELPSFKGACARRLPVQKPQFNPFYHGAANAIQKTLLDIIRYNPSKIKIFNANLFIDNNKVSSTYRLKPNFTTAGFMYHDPVSNFCFTKALYENSLVEADEELSMVLDLSASQYVDKLIEAYHI